MIRFIALLFGVVGALAASQAPGFTQQYLQNLSGRVDELRMSVEKFDRDAREYGLTRAEAVAECEADSTFGGRVCQGRAKDIERYQLLSMQFKTLTDASDWQRPILLARSYDSVIADDTLRAFEPAVPATPAGAGYAAAGFALLWGLASLILGLVTAPFRRY